MINSIQKSAYVTKDQILKTENQTINQKKSDQQTESYKKLAQKVAIAVGIGFTVGGVIYAISKAMVKPEPLPPSFKEVISVVAGKFAAGEFKDPNLLGVIAIVTLGISKKYMSSYKVHKRAEQRTYLYAEKAKLKASNSWANCIKRNENKISWSKASAKIQEYKKLRQERAKKILEIDKKIAESEKKKGRLEADKNQFFRRTTKVCAQIKGAAGFLPKFFDVRQEIHTLKRQKKSIEAGQEDIDKTIALLRSQDTRTIFWS